MAKKQVSTKKIKKKWFPIVAPKMFGGKVLGELLLADANMMKGRHITQNLSNVLNDPKKHSINMQFLIKDVKEGQGITTITKYELISGYIKRLIRRGRTKIVDSFITKSADGKRVRVKTIILTNSYAHKSTQTKIRMNVRELMKKEVAKNTFEKSIEELLKLTIQKEIRKTISKIAPSRNFEIRVFKLEEGKAGEDEKVEEVKVEEEKEEVEVKEVKEEKTEKKEEKPAKKTPVKKAEKKTAVKKAPAKKTPAKKTAAKKSPAKKK
ncbi:MAG: hypothetical protein ABH828_04110 [archaeon]